MTIKITFAPTKYQYQSEPIAVPAPVSRMGFSFRCWRIIDLYHSGSPFTAYRVNCENVQDGSIATKWFTSPQDAQAFVNDFARNSQHWDFH